MNNLPHSCKKENKLNIAVIKQGDQIGRILAYCAIAHFEQSFKKLKKKTNFFGSHFSTLQVTH
jgi:hypothetical protein